MCLFLLYFGTHLIDFILWLFWRLFWSTQGLEALEALPKVLWASFCSLCDSALKGLGGCYGGLFRALSGLAVFGP